MALRGERASEVRADFNRALTVSLDGRRSKFILTAVPIPEFRPGKFGAAAILSDVTEFARLDELRMELVAVASHELKTPLTTLRMNLMLLSERAENLTARQHEILSTAVVGCQELAATIDELLDLTRIEAGQLRLSRDIMDIYGLLDRSIASLRQRFDDASIAVKVQANCRPARVVGDPARLGMVITNLLNNALKYTPAGGTVSISVAPVRNANNGDGNRLRVAVSDTGPGIPVEFRERVFEKFFRVEQQGGREDKGTWGAGIGLYLCRQIIEAHGGTISCAAGDNGHGTRIEMVLPTVDLPSS
jgi:two-component system, NtrC family, sensor histidine kinase KinB